MPELNLKDLATKLRSERFDRSIATTPTSTDPAIDTPMVVTLDELRPYELNPRITRNSKYDEIKASIRERGLDAPPAITRRPGDSHFIIRNGGNTRLAILRELWGETREERFFRIPCLFRPWSARGEIVALTGHLAENELHGDLSFIERALGVDKARELYEQENGNPLSQRELARRLTADGYPISHSLISRMQDTLRHLLPAIPTVLYAGLGKHQVERLSSLRKAASRVWERHSSAASTTMEFGALFQDVLSGFDADPAKFDTRRVQDELLKHMARMLASDYDTLALEIIDAEGIADAINRDPAGQPSLNPPFPLERSASRLIDAAPSRTTSAPPTQPQNSSAGQTRPRSEPATLQGSGRTSHADESSYVEEEFEDDAPDGSSAARVSTPTSGNESRCTSQNDIVRVDRGQAEEPSSFTTLLHIEPSLDTAIGLRSEISRLAAEVAREGSMADRIKEVADGIGYVCIASRSRSKEPLTPFQRSLLALLTALSNPPTRNTDTNTADTLRETLGALLQGSSNRTRSAEAVPLPRLSDASLVKVFRFICLSRRLLDIESVKDSPSERDSA
jgi:ParB family protein of integrating conjugative element (PFGI_1 class)